MTASMGGHLLDDLTEFDDQPGSDGTIEGSIYMFLTANRFRVELRGGQLVDAVLPDELIDDMRKYYVGEPIVERIGVLVRLRQPPALNQIISVQGGDGFIGEARSLRR